MIHTDSRQFSVRGVVAKTILSGVTSESRRIEMRLVVNEDHYAEIVQRGLLTAKASIWISTANIKDAHIEAPIGTRARARGRFVSLFDWLQSQFDAGLDVRLLHAGPPSRALAAKTAWHRGAEVHRACPRVHLKMVAVDGRLLYLGSANLTGAGVGAKSRNRRNFEAGIVTDDPWLLDELQGTFDAIWSGRHCRDCRLRSRCATPLDAISKETSKPSESRARVISKTRASKPSEIGERVIPKTRTPKPGETRECAIPKTREPKSKRAEVRPRSDRKPKDARRK